MANSEIVASRVDIESIGDRIELEDMQEFINELKYLSSLFILNKEGLYLPDPLLIDRDVLFSLMNKRGYRLFLVSDGDSVISDKKKEERFMNEDIFSNKKIMRRIRNGTIRKDSDYEVEKEKELIVFIYNDNQKIVDTFKYELIEETPLEFVERLVNILDKASRRTR